MPTFIKHSTRPLYCPLCISSI